MNEGSRQWEDGWILEMGPLEVLILLLLIAIPIGAICCWSA